MHRTLFCALGVAALFLIARPAAPAQAQAAPRKSRTNKMLIAGGVWRRRLRIAVSPPAGAIRA